LRKLFREAWSDEEEKAAAEAMEELAKRIATRLSRRRRRSKRGALDVRGTLRANLAHGGVPFRVVRRSRRPGRRDLTILADVSGSVRRAARLVLLVIARLRGATTGVRAFAYVDRPALLPAAAARLPLDGVVASLGERGELDPFALSDHGETLRRFRRDHPRAVTGRTVLLILGDARNNRFPAQEWELEALARKAAAVWWLVPEEERLWGSGDSAIRAYAPFCDAVVSAATPAEMIVAAARLVRFWR
jgi:hypothetical protein